MLVLVQPALMKFKMVIMIIDILLFNFKMALMTIFCALEEQKMYNLSVSSMHLLSL